jgi:hypothetical protein
MASVGNGVFDKNISWNTGISSYIKAFVERLETVRIFTGSFNPLVYALV